MLLVEPSKIHDIDAIFKLYDQAAEFQKTVFHKHWAGFERSLVEKEIAESRQWKILSNGEIACIFAITFNDPLIWREKDSDPSIYIHRIVTNPSFRGGQYVKDIVKWALEYAPGIGKEFIRMDTWGDNEKLKEYYLSCGFEYLGITQMDNTDGLPKHYEGLSLALFEIKV